MNLLQEKVKHNAFGLGVITELKGNKICVEFHEEVGSKMFLYPEAFETFLKAMDTTVESDILKELHTKQQQIEHELQEKQREADELREKMKKLEPKKKTVKKTVKKKYEVD